MERKNKTQRLAVSGILIALGTIFSLIVFTRLPMGGSVTFFSMVPVMLLGYMYGVKWGVLCGFIFGILQAVLGISVDSAAAGLSAWSAVLMVILDYLAAYSCLGTAGMFRKLIKKPAVSFSLGCLCAGILRLAAHFASGIILFGSWAEWYFEQDSMGSFGAAILSHFSGFGLSAIYSLIYNAAFMVPEIIISVIAAVILMSAKPIRKICHSEQ